MKILVVVHRFLPRHQTGAELYTYRLAKDLARRHEVVVLTADDAVLQRNHSRRVYSLDNMRVIEITNHRKYDDFGQSYADPIMEEQFRTVLRQEDPDIIHFQHLLHHSVEYPGIARDHGVPSVMTLHEYWFLCARNGQLQRGTQRRVRHEISQRNRRGDLALRRDLNLRGGHVHGERPHGRANLAAQQQKHRVRGLSRWGLHNQHHDKILNIITIHVGSDDAGRG